MLQTAPGTAGPDYPERPAQHGWEAGTTPPATCSIPPSHLVTSNVTSSHFAPLLPIFISIHHSIPHICMVLGQPWILEREAGLGRCPAC